MIATVYNLAYYKRFFIVKIQQISFIQILNIVQQYIKYPQIYN